MVFFYNFKKLGFEKLKLVILNKLVIDGNWKNNVVRKKNEIVFNNKEGFFFFN